MKLLNVVGWEQGYNSMYQYMRARNLCNHRDYQNLGGTVLVSVHSLVNGCRSGAMASDVVMSIGRNQTLDKPALVFFELVGNDVCSGHHTFDTVSV